ncbi:uncharacterized protein TNCV_1901161 [Trichonephila clavipes]|nr:uncharacterized protein TNCV_1901161 [Trichonephila clavipes]
MSEKALVDHIFVRFEPQVQDYVEVHNPQTTIQLLEVLAKFEERYSCKATLGSRNSNNEEGRGWNERRMSNVGNNRGNSRNSEVVHRPNNGRNDYRGSNQNNRQGNQWFENRNRFQNDDRRFNDRGYQFRNRGQNDDFSRGDQKNRGLSENFSQGSRKQMGRLNVLKVNDIKGDQTQSINQSSIKLSEICMSLVELPYVPILLDETFTKALWDTGAEKSFISEETYQKYFFYKQVKKSSTQVITAQGAKCRNMGVVELNIRIRDFKKPWLFHVLADLEYPCVLGIDFIGGSKIILDLDRKSLAIQESQAEDIKVDDGNLRAHLSETKLKVVANVLDNNTIENIIGEKVNCAIIRDLVLTSRDQLIEEQRTDPELGHIYRYLENPEDSSVNAAMCENWSRDVRLVEGLLFYAKYATSLGEMRVYIPKSLRNEIMREFHDKPLAGPYRVLDVTNNNVVYGKRKKRLTINVDQVRIYRHRKCDETEVGTGSSQITVVCAMNQVVLTEYNGDQMNREMVKRKGQRYKRVNESRSGGPERKVQKGSEHRVNKRALSSNYRTNHSLTKFRKKSRREETVTPTTSGYNLRPRIGKREESRPTTERKTQQGGPSQSRKGKERNDSPYIEERTSMPEEEVINNGKIRKGEERGQRNPCHWRSCSYDDPTPLAHADTSRDVLPRAEKLTVWCALWAGGIIGPHFFKNDEGHNVTVNGDRYRAMITNFFIPELNNHDVQELWFQQDGATCYTARATIDLLKDTFGDRLNSRFGPVNWPPRSCDLTPLDYFLWGYVKSLVYADKPQTLDHLEDNIRRVIADIRPQMLEKVIENWTSSLDYIRASRGSPMQVFTFQLLYLSQS